jgi:hypothetical protein
MADSAGFSVPLFDPQLASPHHRHCPAQAQAP